MSSKEIQVSLLKTLSIIPASLAQRLWDKNVFNHCLQFLLEDSTYHQFRILLWVPEDRRIDILEKNLISIASEQHDPKSWADDLVHLCGYWAQLPQKQVYELWEKVFPVLFSGDREIFRIKLNAVAPVILKLGGDEAVRSTLHEIKQVQEWWP